MIYLNNITKLFFISALVLISATVCFGLLASLVYVYPSFLKQHFDFTVLRPTHVSTAIFWILFGSMGSVQASIQSITNTSLNRTLVYTQWGLMIIALFGIVGSYLTKNFGGREYWEFDPIWSLPILLSWLLFIFNLVKHVRLIKLWPVYIWMWITGSVFFVLIFLENYLWLIPYFNKHVITDYTIQWKVNGSLVGCWNQLIYGTAFYIMDKINNSQRGNISKMAFAMWLIGLFNLMFNWGHHIYTLPTEKYIKIVSYAVSMTEWLFLIKIIYTWKRNLRSNSKHYNLLSYKFLMAADWWVFLNLGQALFMSIPAINKYTHGTHITVAHAMGTTIGINTMILFSSCFYFLNTEEAEKYKLSFWSFQIGLFILWASLNLSGITKAVLIHQNAGLSFSEISTHLRNYYVGFVTGGVIIFISVLSISTRLARAYVRSWDRASR